MGQSSIIANSKGLEKVGLFPASILCRVAEPQSGLTPVHADEEKLIEKSVPKRQAEFRAGRHAAHAALRALSADCAVIDRDAQRRPVWPTDVVGSISHTQGCAVAAVGFSQHYAGIGVDVEVYQSLKPEIVQRIATPDEQRCLQSGPESSLIFSAKEALYKMLNPLDQRSLEFQQVCLEWGDGELTAKVNAPGNGVIEVYSGRYRQLENWIFTAFWMAAR